MKILRRISLALLAFVGVFAFVGCQNKENFKEINYDAFKSYVQSEEVDMNFEGGYAMTLKNNGESVKSEVNLVARKVEGLWQMNFDIDEITFKGKVYLYQNVMYVFDGTNKYFVDLNEFLKNNESSDTFDLSSLEKYSNNKLVAELAVTVATYAHSPVEALILSIDDEGADSIKYYQKGAKTSPEFKVDVTRSNLLDVAYYDFNITFENNKIVSFVETAKDSKLSVRASQEWKLYDGIITMPQFSAFKELETLN